MKEHDVIRRAIGEEILDKEKIRRRAVEIAQERAAAEPRERRGERSHIRRRWVWTANLALLAVLAVVLLLITRPYWRPAGEEPTTAPTGPRTADPAVLATLPDTVAYNAERDEYYDTAFLTWDGAAGRYRILWNGTPPVSFYQTNGIDPDVWRLCFAGPDDPLDRLLPEVFADYRQMVDENPALATHISMSSYSYIPMEGLEGPLSLLADLRLSLLPRMFGYMDLGAGAITEHSLGLCDMFRFITARIEAPGISYREGFTKGTDRWEIMASGYPAAWGADVFHQCSALLAVFRDRVNQAPAELADLIDPQVSSEYKAKLMATYGVAALPLYFQSVLLYGEEGYLPYVHAALPMWLIRRETGAGRVVDASTDPAVLRGYLAECWEDAQGVFAVGQYRFRWEEDADSSDHPYYISRFDGRLQESRMSAALGDGIQLQWSVSLWDRHAPAGPDEGRYTALVSLDTNSALSEADREKLTGTVRFSFSTPSFTAAFECDLDTREIRTLDPVTGEPDTSPEVAAVLDHEPDSDEGPSVLKIIVGFSGPPVEEDEVEEVTCRVDGISTEMQKARRGG